MGRTFIIGTPAAGGWAASTGFPLFTSKSFHPVFIKLGEYVGGHNTSIMFYNKPNLPLLQNNGLWIVKNCPKRGRTLSY